jgi:hypothetical protein
MLRRVVWWTFTDVSEMLLLDIPEDSHLQNASACNDQLVNDG